MSKLNLSYHSFNEKGKEVLMKYTLSDEQTAIANRAMKNFTTSKTWINNKYSYIWQYAYKAYHLDTEDRQLYLKTWQSNIAWGLIRSFIDVFVSTLTERPISFSVTGMNEQ